jgi:hypothetical protein
MKSFSISTFLPRSNKRRKKNFFFVLFCKKNFLYFCIPNFLIFHGKADLFKKTRCRTTFYKLWKKCSPNGFRLLSFEKNSKFWRRNTFSEKSIRSMVLPSSSVEAISGWPSQDQCYKTQGVFTVGLSWMASCFFNYFPSRQIRDKLSIWNAMK